MKNHTETEFKVIAGCSQDLETLVQDFLGKHEKTKPSRKYIFTTEYYDTKDKDFLNNGYVLRFRPERNEYSASIEIKQTHSINPRISQRFELTVRPKPPIRKAGFLSLYFNIISNPAYPKCLVQPKPNHLKCFMKCVVARTEIDCVIRKDGKFNHVEIAMDEIFYLDAHDRVMNTVPEHEVEFEIKDGDMSMEEFVLLMDAFVFDHQNVQKTLESKSTRGIRQLQLA